MSDLNVNNNLEVTIEKFEFLGVEHEQHPSFQLDRYVVQNITDITAGFIWVFLQSLPPNWEVNKYHLMRHFDIGEQKLKKHMAFLKKSSLIDYIFIRDKLGVIQSVKIKVLNGSKFNSEREVPFGTKPSLRVQPPPFNMELSTQESEQESGVLSTGMKTHRVGHPPSGKSSTYSINTNNSIKTNKIDRSIESIGLSDSTKTDEIEIRDYVRLKFNDLTFSATQAKNMLTSEVAKQMKVTVKSICESADNFIKAFTANPELARKPLPTFIHHMKNEGHYSHSKQFTKDKTTCRNNDDDIQKRMREEFERHAEEFIELLTPELEDEIRRSHLSQEFGVDTRHFQLGTYKKFYYNKVFWPGIKEQIERDILNGIR